MRPLRIYTLVPHIRRVVVELFRGFREILLVTIFMVCSSSSCSSDFMLFKIVVMFMFGSYGVQLVGGKLASCNDIQITTRVRLLSVFILVHMNIFLGKLYGVFLVKTFCHTNASARQGRRFIASANIGRARMDKSAKLQF